ncbi:MAG: hypothetical protein DME98_18385 [Verrucomicrobia bacterium]|nr:MAG: hypothetical protein DME98_18385 [Verrucomicrobiota bacterium]
MDAHMTNSSILILLAAGCIIAPALTYAQANATPTVSRAFPDRVSSSDRAAGASDPGYRAAAASENVQSLDPAAATQAWLATMPRAQREKSDAYFEGGYWLILWNFLLAVAISVFLLASRISVRLRDFAERITGFKTLQVIAYALPYLVIVYVLSFPLNLYEHFFREHQYGFATQSFLSWFREQLIGVGVAIIGGTILLIVLYAVFRRAPRTWWIWGTVVAVSFMFVVVFIAPVFIEPLFNTYKPLTKPEIRDPILAMARANQIPVKQVFEVDASRQTTRVSANVSGVLGTTRIALNDNLLKQCTLPEIREVMAHEMGHRRSRRALGQQMEHARNRRSGRASIARVDFERATFRRDAVSEYGRTRHRTRSRRLWNQYFPGTGRHGESRAQTWRLSQTRSSASGRIHFFRSSQWPRPHSHGHGLESGKFASRSINSVRKLFDVSVSQCSPLSIFVRDVEILAGLNEVW